MPEYVRPEPNAHTRFLIYGMNGALSGWTAPRFFAPQALRVRQQMYLHKKETAS